MAIRIETGRETVSFASAALLAGAASCASAALFGFGAFYHVAWPVCVLIAGTGLVSAISRRAGLIMKAAIGAAALIFLLINIRSGGMVSGAVNNVRLAFASADMDLISPSMGIISAALSALIALLIESLIFDHGSGTAFFASAFGLLTVLFCGGGLYEVLPAAMGALLSCASSDENRSGALRAVIPALVIVLISLLISPQEGSVYEPLGRLSDRVKRMYEQYLDFTDERVAFTIAEKGYDYYGLYNDEPTHLLGGPADPDAGAVMYVESEVALLLRGTVRGVYTGVSWTDASSRERNLYYDIFRRELRNGVFGMDYERNAAFTRVNARVSFLAPGTSAVFAASPLEDISCPLENALYYNTAGELFFTRGVVSGDSYSFTSYALTAPGLLTESDDDPGYAAAAAEYLQLPGGIDSEVYSITQSVVQGYDTDIAKALAIKDYLSRGFKYKLDVGYPDPSRDFVSQFLLQTKEGYCTYFASAFTVMCRIAGIPARYIEGYVYEPGDDGTNIITGESAHAWSEIYIRGAGFVPIDVTPGQENGREQGEIEDEPLEGPGDDGAPNEETDGGAEPPEDEGDDAPENDQNGDDGHDNDAGGEEDDQSDPGAPEASSGGMIWALIAVLLLLAALILFIVLRLRATDPVRMCERASGDRERAFILFRALLSLLAASGFEMRGGETPVSFIQRLSSVGVDTKALSGFAGEMERAAYSPDTELSNTVKLGKEAYTAARKAIKRISLIRFDARRILRGIGDTRNLP